MDTDDGIHALCRVKQVYWFFIGFLTGLLVSIIMFYVTLMMWAHVPRVSV